MISEAATAQHTITNQHNPASLSTDPPTPLSTLRVYKEVASRPSQTLSLIERSERFPDCLLVTFLWQRGGLKHAFSLISPPTISSTSPCRLQPIYYSRMSATIRLSNILVHTPSLAPLPHIRGPGHNDTDDGTVSPSCDANSNVPLCPSDSAAPCDAAPPHNVAHSDAAPPRNVAHSDAVPPRNVAHSDAAPPRNVAHDNAAPPRNVAHSNAAPPRNIAHCDAPLTCDIAKPRRGMEQKGRRRWKHRMLGGRSEVEGKGRVTCI